MSFSNCGLHVGHANMSHAAILLRVEQALPNLDRLIGADRPQAVNQHKVNVIDAELLTVARIDSSAAFLVLTAFVLILLVIQN